MTPKQLHIARQLREEGLTLDAIATGLGYTKQGVSWALNREPTPPLYLTDEERAERKKAHDRRYYRRRCGLA